MYERKGQRPRGQNAAPKDGRIAKVQNKGISADGQLARKGRYQNSDSWSGFVELTELLDTEATHGVLGRRYCRLNVAQPAPLQYLEHHIKHTTCPASQPVQTIRWRD